jgi:hypothetical protein
MSVLFLVRADDFRPSGGASDGFCRLEMQILQPARCRAPRIERSECRAAMERMAARGV